MKKILLLMSILFLVPSFAQNMDMKDFNPSCYKYIGELNLNGTTKVLSDSKVDLFVQNNKIVPFKSLSLKEGFINYSISLSWNKQYLQDGNRKTFLELDTDKVKEIILTFDQKVQEDTFRPYFDIVSENYYPEVYISEDGKKYSKVQHITNFSFKYLKIKFIPKNPNDNIREKIKIRELFLYNKFFTYIVDAKWKVIAYADNKCKKSKYYSNTNWNFTININTSIQRLFLKANPNFNPIEQEKDSDGDKIIDSQDNCPTIYNPQQKDKDGDGKGDKCSDVDNDRIIGYKDNCPYVFNPDQKDVNVNNVWDACEFDKDKDGVFDSLDNCMTTYNPDQKDDDNDGIWNKCDNCKLYNPRQLDKNHNWIWDVCEEHEKYIKEHDKDKDGIIDSQDNCPFVSNKDQKDYDKDWVWDVCDNCKMMKNSDQKDENKNGIWDICEDSDKDGIIWLTDNCINVYNPDQKDSDNDGIWDVCEDDDSDGIIFAKDNCPYVYNPDQKDIDKDGKWDKCDKKDDRFLESNKNVFIALIFVLILWFAVGIFFMVKKMNDF